MELIIIAGQSGAGLSTALGALEDMGYDTVRALPADMLEQYAQNRAQNAGVSLQLRSAQDAEQACAVLSRMKDAGTSVRLMYLEADEQTLINRYKFTRRPHPLMRGERTMVQAIRAEKELLRPIRAMADNMTDTSRMNDLRLREEMSRLLTGESGGLLSVSVVSFGFKHGIPADADLVLDVRFLPNPYWEPALRSMSGLDDEVLDYVFRDGTAQQYMDKLTAMTDFLIPQYRREGKSALTIAIGCTGGRHRSVSVVRALARHFEENGVSVSVIHRDVRL